LNEPAKPILYIVAMPIGNPKDITLRALEVLKEVDILICEERKIGFRYRSAYGLKQDWELLNEHNYQEQSPILLKKLIDEHKSAALVSDAGTPLFADPGAELVLLCRKENIPVIPIPGASSLMTALMGSGLDLKQFMYYGFLPANTEQRLQALKKIRTWQDWDIVFLETPYRLKQFLRDMMQVLGAKRKGIIAYRLTFPEEQFIRGELDKLSKVAETLPKGEFVFILQKGCRRC
jgi:16S rRNA (cytidine1402-2'-O)-methyltransferase